jgi:isochorismate synthase
MQVGESEIAVYVGGGITKDSQVQEEWEETVLKSKTLIDRIVQKFDMN